jgi:hypothetical protein
MTVMLLVVVIGAAFMVPVRPVFGVIGIVFCGPLMLYTTYLLIYQLKNARRAQC